MPPDKPGRNDPKLLVKLASSPYQTWANSYQFNSSNRDRWAAWRRRGGCRSRNADGRDALQHATEGLHGCYHHTDMAGGRTTHHAQRAMYPRTWAGTDRAIGIEHNLDHACGSAKQQLILRIDHGRGHSRTQRQGEPQQGQFGQPGCVAQGVQNAHGARLWHRYSIRIRRIFILFSLPNVTGHRSGAGCGVAAHKKLPAPAMMTRGLHAPLLLLSCHA